MNTIKVEAPIQETIRAKGNVYDLNIRNNLASVTILVRHNGHSLEPAITSSEQERHIARCLCKVP